MNRKQLEAASKAFKKYVALDKHSQTALEAIDALLATMPPVDIPPDGCLVGVWSKAGQLQKVRYSTGELDSDNKLACYVGGNKCGVVSYWAKWCRIPYLLQFTPHDGAEKRPCEESAIVVKYKNGHILSWNVAGNARWGDIVAWAYQKDLRVE